MNHRRGRSFASTFAVERTFGRVLWRGACGFSEVQGGEKFSMGKFLPGKIPPQSLKVMGKIAPPFSMVKGKA